MATEYSFRNYLFAISPHQDFDEDPSTSLTNDFLFVGMSPKLPTPKWERIEIERSRNYLEPWYTDTELSQRGVPQEFELDEFDCPKSMLNYWLAAFFQNVSDSGSGTYEHVFTPPTVNPDFAGDAGYLFHLIARHPVSGRNWMYDNCIVTGLSIRLSHDEAVGNRLTVKPTILARKPDPLMDPVSWTISYPTETFWLTNQLTGEDDDSVFSVDSDTPELYEMVMNMVNNGAGRGQDSAGRPRQFRVNYYTCEGEIRCLKTTDTDGWLADITGSNLITAYAYYRADSGSPTAGDLRFDLRLQWAEGHDIEEGEVEEQVAVFPFKTSRDTSNPSLKITTVDAITTIDSLFT